MIQLQNEDQIRELFIETYRECVDELKGLTTKKIDPLTDSEIADVFDMVNETAKSQYIYWLAEGLRRTFQSRIKLVEFADYKHLFDFLLNKLREKLTK